ncbi:MAG: PhoH family protein, partial [Campylobacterales bacterium]|nr:PhoH family protein [Campylobacterales bacterium]
MSFRISAEIRGIRTQSIRNSSVEAPEQIDFSYTYEYEETPALPEKHEHHNFDQITFIQKAVSTTSEHYETGIQRYAFPFNGQLEWCEFDRRFGEHFDEMLVRPLNLEQKFYYAMMTHPQNYVTVVAGSTGSGKTLVALQAGLELVEEGIVEGIVYARNTVTANDPQSELGFRKGDEEQKLGYFMYPLYAAINFTIEHQSSRSIDARVEYTGNVNSIKRENATEIFMQKYNIEAMDIAHMRGTTISRKFVIIDEAQNMTNATLKLIGTRMGDETRLVVMGDPGQIDHPFLSKRRNALVTLLNKAQHSDFIAGIQLRHTIRSVVADWFDKNF